MRPGALRRRPDSWMRPCPPSPGPRPASVPSSSASARMEVDLDLDRPTRPARRPSARPRRSASRCAEPGASTFLDLKPVELRVADASTATALDARRLWPTAGSSCTASRPTTSSWSEATMALQPRRAGPAPRRRPRRRGALRLRPPLPRRGAQRVRLLRPARPQGAVCRVRHRPGGLAGPRQRRRRARWQPGRWELAATQPLATYFVTVCAGPWALRARASTTAYRSGIHARASLREPLERQADADARGDPGLLRLLPPAVRDPVPVRRVPPGVRARVQRRRDGEPGLRDLPRHVRLPRRRGARRGARRAPTPSRTRWRTCGSATS